MDRRRLRGRGETVVDRLRVEEREAEVVQVALAQYALKTSWEVLATPMTYWIVNYLKRKENEDYYDIHTNFTPFRVKV